MYNYIAIDPSRSFISTVWGCTNWTSKQVGPTETLLLIRLLPTVLLLVLRTRNNTGATNSWYFLVLLCPMVIIIIPDTKKAKYWHLGGSLSFIPTARETIRIFAPLTQAFLKDLGLRITRATGEARSHSYLIQRVSIAIHAELREMLRL